MLSLSHKVVRLKQFKLTDVTVDNLYDGYQSTGYERTVCSVLKSWPVWRCIVKEILLLLLYHSSKNHLQGDDHVALQRVQNPVEVAYDKCRPPTAFMPLMDIIKTYYKNTTKGSDKNPFGVWYDRMGQ